MTNELVPPIVLSNGETVVINEDVQAAVGQPAVDLSGDQARVIVRNGGSVSAPDSGNTAILATGDSGIIFNLETISGDFNGISSTGDSLRLVNRGEISSNSRAVDLSDGDGLNILNFGSILGTDDQRNGTLYVDGTVDDLRLLNQASGVIDAGESNLGDAVSVQVGAADDDSNDNIRVVNRGVLQGRGDGPEVFADGARVAANGSSGLRYFNGSDVPEATVTGSVINRGTITAEVNIGFLGGLVIEDSVAFDGRIVNRRGSEISGPRNGLYVGDAEHDLRIRNLGTIESGSRAVNLDGDNVRFTNLGSVAGTGDQRNGTLYIDGTADDTSVRNLRRGVIDAGEGNLGDAIAIQVGAADDATSENISILNRGLLQGRGDGLDVFAEGDRVAANGSSGLRFFNGSGQAETTVSGSVINRGTITAEVNVGFLGGLVVEDGVGFDGLISNRPGGTISGPRNGLYIGDAQHNLFIENLGQIESGSRAVNLDGDNVILLNQGTILGTADQRNGTLYLDGTADNIIVDNQVQGVIDAGAGNSGSGVSVQVGAANGLGDGIDDLELSATISNSGLIQGRGEGNVPAGVRLFLGSGLTEATFTGDITNQQGGVIASEQQAGVLIESGVIFNGQITNLGTITGGNGFAIDADGALGVVDVVNQGQLNGAVRLGAGSDSFIQEAQGDATVSGGLGSDIITGGAGNDSLSGGGDDDLLTGGLGNDTFTFETNTGVDTVTDFAIAGDVLDVSAIFSDLASVLGAASQDGANTVIDFGAGNAAVLLNTDVNTLTGDNFAFV